MTMLRAERRIGVMLHIMCRQDFKGLMVKYLSQQAYPDRKIPKEGINTTAIKNKIPTSDFTGKKPAPKGRSIQTNNTGAKTIIGAIKNNVLSAFCGNLSSLKKSFIPCAIICKQSVRQIRFEVFLEI